MVFRCFFLIGFALITFDLLDLIIFCPIIPNLLFIFLYLAIIIILIFFFSI